MSTHTKTKSSEVVKNLNLEYKIVPNLTRDTTEINKLNKEGAWEPAQVKGLPNIFSHKKVKVEKPNSYTTAAHLIFFLTEPHIEKEEKGRGESGVSRDRR